MSKRIVEIDMTTPPTTGDALVFDGTKWVPQAGGGGGGVTDHGALTGLADDDHTQYLNNTRGDARYYTETELNAGQLDSRYYTESEVDALLAASSGVLSGSMTVTVPANSYEHSEVVAVTGMTAANRVIVSLAAHLDTDENDPDLLDLVNLLGETDTGQITVRMTFSERTSGPIKLVYMGV